MCTAIKNGDLDRLLVPSDSKSRKCGVDNNVIDKPYLMFFNLEKCIDPRVPLYGCKTPQVCVQQCPSTSFIYSHFQCNSNTFSQIRSQLICTMDVPLDTIQSCDDINDRIKRNECASWYLPSNSCMKLNLIFNQNFKFFSVHHFVFILFCVECRLFMFVIILYDFIFCFVFYFYLCLMLFRNSFVANGNVCKCFSIFYIC